MSLIDIYFFTFVIHAYGDLGIIYINCLATQVFWRPDCRAPGPLLHVEKEAARWILLHRDFATNGSVRCSPEPPGGALRPRRGFFYSLVSLVVPGVHTLRLSFFPL